MIAKGRAKDDAVSTCLIDIMLSSDIYKDNLEILVNDLIILKIAGTDTSRNTVTTALCHLAKNSMSREKVRSEIAECMKRHGTDEVMKLGYE